MRDCFGRYCPIMGQDELENHNMIIKRIRDLERDKKKQARLTHNESNLLYQLVNFFNDPYYPELETEPCYSVKQFKRKPYHEILMSHPLAHNRQAESKITNERKVLNSIARASFSRFINRVAAMGWVRKIKHGKHLYLKITKSGLDKIRIHHDFRNGII